MAAVPAPQRADKADTVIAPPADQRVGSAPRQTRPKHRMIRQYELVERVHAYDPNADEWCEKVLDYALARPLADEPWPEGVLDLRGPTF